MKTIHFGLILLVVIIFGYQNCIRPKNADGQLTNLSAGIKLSEENIQKITFLNTENITVQRNSNTFTMVSEVSYAVDMSNGEIHKSSHANSDIEDFCLTDDFLNELRDILLVSSICKTELVPQDNRVCNQVYNPGYAALTTSRESFDLGSSSDSCGSLKIDLCESTSVEMLKGWFQAVRNQLTQLSCSK